MDVQRYCDREIHCSCGKIHYCPISDVVIEKGALEKLPQLLTPYAHVFLVADDNTFAVCGERVYALLGDRAAGRLVYHREGLLIPDEEAVEELRAAMPENTDFVVGVGSGVINDICKYTTFEMKMDYAIVGTAPSMDGYASSGAAMIMEGMKITYTTRPPKMIIADTEILKDAPMDMIRAGYGDIIGKYSSLNDWRLSHLVTGEYFCQEIYDLVLELTNHIRDSVHLIAERDEEAIADLTRALVLSGVTLSLAGTTRPGSGSEHHLSHFFEIVGLVRKEPYFIHGIDVAYSTVVTAAIREQIRALPKPVLHMEDREGRLLAWRKIFGPIAGEVEQLQKDAGLYDRELSHVYRERWPEILDVLKDCPTEKECVRMFEDAGYRMGDFEALYGREKIRQAMLYGKDLKNRYSVLWLYYALFSGKGAEEDP